MKDFKLFKDDLFPDYLAEIMKENLGRQEKKERDVFRLGLLKGMTPAGVNGMPMIKKCTVLPPDVLLTFPQARAMRQQLRKCSCGVHFYINDDAFMCFVRNTDRYLPMLRRIGYMIGPDLSIKVNMPYPMKLFNSYVNKLLTVYCQNNGIITCPNVVWADPETYDECFEGYPRHSIVAVNSMGILHNPKSLYFWQRGYDEMINRLNPIKVIRYGERIPGEDESISIYYENNHINRMRNGR